MLKRNGANSEALLKRLNDEGNIVTTKINRALSQGDAEEQLDQPHKQVGVNTEISSKAEVVAAIKGCHSEKGRQHT